MINNDIINKLKNSTVAVFGVGGVGSFAANALAKSKIGAIDFFDDDKICLTNINRQLIATRKTIGKSKVAVMRDIVLKANPECKVTVYECFYSAENADSFDFTKYDYIIDAIDTVSSKLVLIENAKKAGVPIICCMGAGNKLQADDFEVEDIFSTTVCPLAKVMRRELRVRGIDSLKVIYSKEPPITPKENDEISCKNHCVCPPGTKRKCTVRRQVPGSISFVPSAAGLLIANEVISDLTAERTENQND